MPDERHDTDAAEEAFRELVVSARVYYRNDKRVDFAEWQHLINEANELGLDEQDALRAARQATGNDKWSPPLPPPVGASIDGSLGMRVGSAADSLEAVSLDASGGEVMTSRLKAGLVINGTYRLEEQIGAGGMGVVWRAVHTKLGTEAAIKFLKRAMDEEAAARFLREARMAAKLQSPHLARVFDCAQLQTGELFIVMEYLRGRGLDARLKDDGPLPVAEAVDCIAQACLGLAEAHKQGIVHRDIKPANLFLAETDEGGKEIRIVDFGLSRLAQEDGEALTRDQILLGTPEYAPPEQFGSAMNARVPSDVWSLGATLYCLIAGEPPFAKDANLSGLYQMSDLLKRVTGEPPPPLSESGKVVPEELEAVILKCMQKRPEDRYPTVADLVEDLAPFGSEAAQKAAVQVVSTLGREPSERLSVLSHPRQEERGTAARLWAVGLAAVVVFGVLVYLVTG